MIDKKTASEEKMKKKDQMIIDSVKLSFSYQNTDKQVLQNVNLQVRTGECVVLCGKSGCGKTTFSRFLNGLSPSFFGGDICGTCKVCGLKTGEDPIEAYVLHVGSVFQNPKTQYFNVDTTAELAFPCENMGMEPEKIQDRINLYAEELHLTPLLDRSVFALSGGEKQRLAFGSACMLEPELLVLDEPTSNLDKQAMKQLHDLIEKKKREGCTIVIAEHRLAWIADLVDRLILFEDGKITREWNQEELQLLDEKMVHSYGLRSLNLATSFEKLDQKKMPERMQKSFLTVENLTIGYGKKKVLTIPKFSISDGEIIGIMGYNGVGKSTFAATLCGLMEPIDGEILIDGKRARKNNRIKNSFLVMQDVNYQLFLDSVLEEVKMGAVHPDRVEEVLRELDLDQLADRHPMSLSGGQKQRTAIACAVLSEKRLILFDEPTSGLDYWHMQQVGKQLQWLKKQKKAVLVITHDEEFAAEWCDFIFNLEEQ